MLKLPVLSLTPPAAEVAVAAAAAVAAVAVVEDVVLEMVCSHLGQPLGVLEVVVLEVV
jgi:hypothetical protein